VSSYSVRKRLRIASSSIVISLPNVEGAQADQILNHAYNMG
jgi:hypothetical protein